MLTNEDLAILNLARGVLERLEKESLNQFFSRDRAGNGREVDSVDGHGLGRISQAACAAGDAIFDCLNVTNAYGKREMTYEQLHGHPQPEEVEA